MEARVEIVNKQGKSGKDYQVLCVYVKASNGKEILVSETYVNDALKSVLEFIQG